MNNVVCYHFSRTIVLADLFIVWRSADNRVFLGRARLAFRLYDSRHFHQIYTWSISVFNCWHWDWGHLCSSFLQCIYMVLTCAVTVSFFLLLLLIKKYLAPRERKKERGSIGEMQSVITTSPTRRVKLNGLVKTPSITIWIQCYT